MKRWFFVLALVMLTTSVSAQYYQVKLRARLMYANNNVRCDSWFRIEFNNPGTPLQWFRKVDLNEGSWGTYETTLIVHADSIFTSMRIYSKRETSDCTTRGSGDKVRTISLSSYPCYSNSFPNVFSGYDSQSSLAITITPATAPTSAPNTSWTTSTTALIRTAGGISGYFYTVSATYTDNTTEVLLSRDLRTIDGDQRFLNRVSSARNSRKLIKQISVLSFRFFEEITRTYTINDDGSDLSIWLNDADNHPLPFNSPESWIHIRVFQPKTPVEASSSTLPSNNNVVIRVNENHNNYQWRYKIENGTWRLFPAGFGYTNTVSVSGESLLGAAWKSNVFKNIHIKATYRCATGYETEIITLRHLPSAPAIVRVDPIPESCAGYRDAKFRIKFNRPLYSGANLGVPYNEVLYVFVDNETKASYPTALEADSTITVGDVTFSPGDHTIHLTNLFGAMGAGYSDGPDHTRVSNMPVRLPVDNLFTDVSAVHCHGGADGQISFSTQGGTASFKAYLSQGGTELQNIDFSQGAASSFTALAAGDYVIRYHDSNGCIPLDGVDEVPFSVSQPADALVVIGEENQEPLGYGLSNGYVTVRAQAGSYPYTFEWTDKQSGDNLSGDTPVEEGQSMTSRLSNIGKGMYHVLVKDDQYGLVTTTSETNLRGCYDTLTMIVEEPPLLEVSLKEHHFVSCYGYHDGAVEANARGGRPYLAPHTFEPYQYEWYVLQDGTPILFNEIDSIAFDRASAVYRVKVTDRNGISAWSDDFFLDQPALLRLSFITPELKCNGDVNGTSEVFPVGGTYPYAYQWSTGETGKSISNLTDGPYSVVVTDERGCTSLGTTQVTVPNGLAVNAILKDPTCYQYADGSISLEVTGGAPGYEYVWSTGGASPVINGLSEGDYDVTITDGNGCFVHNVFSLHDPELFPVNIGEDRVLCRGQVLPLDASIDDDGATYAWTLNGSPFSDSPIVEITEPGNYSLAVRNTIGCDNTRSIAVSRVDTEIACEFVVATRVPRNERVRIANISFPYPERSAWLLPDNVDILNQTDEYVELLFPAFGQYEIGLASYTGDCEKVVMKTVTAVDRSELADYIAPDEPYVKQFIVSPNPNDGLFRVNVELREAGNFRLLFYSSQGNIIAQRDIVNQSVSETSFDLRGSVSSGIYMMQLLTSAGTATVKVTIE